MSCGVFLCSLRPRASSSSSQSERSASPLVMNSTQSLDIMPRFAISAEEEGEIHKHVHLYILILLFYTTPVLKLCTFLKMGWLTTCGAFDSGATAQAPGRPSGEALPDASLTSWRRQRNPDPQLEKSPSLPPSLACPSSSLQVHRMIIISS